MQQGHKNELLGGFVYAHALQSLLIPEQQVTDNNKLFDLAIIPYDLQTTPLHEERAPAHLQPPPCPTQNDQTATTADHCDT
jgi:hypothetical protein